MSLDNVQLYSTWTEYRKAAIEMKQFHYTSVKKNNKHSKAKQNKKTKQEQNRTQGATTRPISEVYTPPNPSCAPRPTARKP